MATRQFLLRGTSSDDSNEKGTYALVMVSDKCVAKIRARKALFDAYKLVDDQLAFLAFQDSVEFYELLTLAPEQQKTPEDVMDKCAVFMEVVDHEWVGDMTETVNDYMCLDYNGVWWRARDDEYSNVTYNTHFISYEVIFEGYG